MGKQTVVALFANSGDARQSITRLFNLGFPVEDIGFLEPGDVSRRKSPTKRALASTVLGASSLAVAGGVLGAFVVGLSSIGAVIAAMVGVGFGGYAGAILGGFFGTDGFSDDESYFMREIGAGRIMVVARVPDLQGQARAASVLHDSNALEVDSLGTARLQAPLRHPTGRTMLAALDAAETETRAA